MFSKKFIIGFILGVSLISGVSYASRIPKPQRITAFDDNNLVIINEVLENLWNITNGRYVNFYGNMYADNISQTVTISAIDTFYQIGGGFTGGSVNGFIFQNSKELKCVESGTYLVLWHLSIDTTSSNDEIEGVVFKNGSPLLNTSCHTTIPAASKGTGFSGGGIISLSKDDLISLGVNNHTAIRNITVEHGGLSLVKVSP